MTGYIAKIEEVTRTNTDYRRILYTGKHSQLVVMNILPGDAIGEEVHTLDQFIRIEQGSAKVILDGVETAVQQDYAIIVPAGTTHNVINVGVAPLKLYTLYAPPEHKDGIVEATKADEIEAGDEVLCALRPVA